MVLAHPGGDAAEVNRGQGERPEVVIVGPEGGFTDSEVERAGLQGVQTIDLGRSILRVETAAIVMLTLAGVG